MEAGRGRVRTFQFNDVTSAWEPLGQAIDGLGKEDALGDSVALSADGRILAVGAGLNSDFGFEAGHVLIFQFNAESLQWEQLGQALGGRAPKDRSDRHVFRRHQLFGNLALELSADGLTVAVGCDQHGTILRRVGAMYKFSNMIWRALVGVS